MHDRAIPQIASRRSEAGVGEGQAEKPISSRCEAETLGHSEFGKVLKKIALCLASSEKLEKRELE